MLSLLMYFSCCVVICLLITLYDYSVRMELIESYSTPYTVHLVSLSNAITTINRSPSPSMPQCRIITILREVHSLASFELEGSTHKQLNLYTSIPIII